MNWVPRVGPSGLPCSTASAFATSPVAVASISSVGSFKSSMTTCALRRRNPPTCPASSVACRPALWNSTVPLPPVSGAKPGKYSSVASFTTARALNSPSPPRNGNLRVGPWYESMPAVAVPLWNAASSHAMERGLSLPIGSTLLTIVASSRSTRASRSRCGERPRPGSRSVSSPCATAFGCCTDSCGDDTTQSPPSRRQSTSASTRSASSGARNQRGHSNDGETARRLMRPRPCVPEARAVSPRKPGQRPIGRADRLSTSAATSKRGSEPARSRAMSIRRLRIVPDGSSPAQRSNERGASASTSGQTAPASSDVALTPASNALAGCPRQRAPRDAAATESPPRACSRRSLARNTHASPSCRRRSLPAMLA